MLRVIFIRVYFLNSLSRFSVRVKDVLLKIIKWVVRVFVGGGGGLERGFRKEFVYLGRRRVYIVMSRLF